MYEIFKKCTYMRKKEVLAWKNNYMYTERETLGLMNLMVKRVDWLRSKLHLK